MLNKSRKGASNQQWEEIESSGISHFGKFLMYMIWTSVMIDILNFWRNGGKMMSSIRKIFSLHEENLFYQY